MRKINNYYAHVGVLVPEVRRFIMDRNKEISYNFFLSYRPGLDELTEHVAVGTKWYLLGTLLHLDDRRLDGINQLQGQDDTDKTLRMFQHWLTTTPTASRRQILEALRKRVISENTVFDHYENYLKELHESTCKSLQFQSYYYTDHY